MLNAFCRVAPSVLFNFLAIREAGVFLFAIVFSSRTSPEVHARRFFALLAIEPPFQMQTTCIPCGNKRKAERRDGQRVCCRSPPDGFDHKYGLVSCVFNNIWPWKQIFLPRRTGTILPLRTEMCVRPDDGTGVLVGSKSVQECRPPPRRLLITLEQIHAQIYSRCYRTKCCPPARAELETSSADDLTRALTIPCVAQMQTGSKFAGGSGLAGTAARHDSVPLIGRVASTRLLGDLPIRGIL